MYRINKTSLIFKVNIKMAPENWHQLQGEGKAGAPVKRSKCPQGWGARGGALGSQFRPSSAPVQEASTESRAQRPAFISEVVMGRLVMSRSGFVSNTNISIQRTQSR